MLHTRPYAYYIFPVSYVFADAGDRRSDAVLNRTCSEIALKKKDVKFSNQQLKLLIEKHLIPGLQKESPLFALLYQEIVYARSYYEGLKVSKPDEFDLNIVMKIPASLEHIQVVTTGAPNEHLRILNVKTAIEAHILKFPNADPNGSKQTLGWCNENGTFLPTGFKKWFISLVISYIDRNKEALKRSLNKREVSAQSMGIAVTLKLEGLSIDLVPCFEFKSPVLPAPLPFRRLKKLAPLEWYAVPSSQSDAWRLSFVKQERAMLHNTQNVKPAIKLIKKLAESLEWTKQFHLKSYHIKTVALWEIHANKNMLVQNIYNVFINLLRRLEARIRSNQLLSFWDSRLNLSERDFPKVVRSALANSTTDYFERFPAAIEDVILNGSAN